jgi:hypothetical protein
MALPLKIGATAVCLETNERRYYPCRTQSPVPLSTSLVYEPGEPLYSSAQLFPGKPELV